MGEHETAPVLLAGVESRAPVDGRSLMPLIKDRQFYPGRAIVLENWCQTDERSCYDPYSPTTPRYRGVRTDRYAYMRYPNGEQELYDRKADPYELNNVAADPAYADKRKELQTQLEQLMQRHQAWPDKMPLDEGIRSELPKY